MNFSTVGFVGTSRSMTSVQKSAVESLINRLNPKLIHLGNSTAQGASGQIRDFANRRGSVVFHAVNDKRIVSQSLALVAAPAENVASKNYVWEAIDYARKAGRYCYVVFPNGSTIVR